MLPTLLELAGVTRPREWRGKEAVPLDGNSFSDALTDPAAPSTHAEQYAEMTGNRAFYRDGWKLVTLHRPGRPHDEDPWELYDLRTDPTETRDLAADRPELVGELAAAWERAAWDNQVFPLDDGTGYLWTARPPGRRADADRPGPHGGDRRRDRPPLPVSWPVYERHGAFPTAAT
nr:hypothetical protein GCM10020093_036160 [Planobispora longispora]